MTPKTNGVWFPVYQKLMDAAAAHNRGNTDLFAIFGMPALPVPHPYPTQSPSPVSSVEGSAAGTRISHR